MTASDRLREIGKDIHWEGSSIYNRPLVGAIALAKAFDEILLLVEAAERLDATERPRVRVSELNDWVSLKLRLADLEKALS